MMCTVFCMVFSAHELVFMFAMSLSVRLSNVCALDSGNWNFPQYFYAVWYAGHLLTSR